jgi:hypothetical protein
MTPPCNIARLWWRCEVAIAEWFGGDIPRSTRDIPCQWGMVVGRTNDDAVQEFVSTPLTLACEGDVDVVECDGGNDDNLVVSLCARTCRPHCQAHGVGHLLASLCIWDV